MRLVYKSCKDFSAAIKPFVDEVSSDILGNIKAHKRGTGTRIMLIAHHDVVCLMISHIDENGFIYVKPCGGIDVALLPARKVVIHHEDNKVTGIIGKKPVHLIRDEGNNAKLGYDEIWVDIGAKNKNEAMKKVCIGDYAYFCSDYDELPNGLITGAYIDDMAGLNVLLELAEQLQDKALQWDVYYVASNYEEIGMRGARVAAHEIHPDVCVCIDVTHATDYPTLNVIRDGDIKLGEGCVLAKGPNVFFGLFETLRNTAAKNKIPYQIEASPYPTGTDANIIQLMGDGVKTAVVSIPCRYMHTPHEMCSLKDIDSAVKIIEAFLRLYHSS